MADDSSRWGDVCWICLQDSIETSQSTPLVYPCACPRAVHQACLAKWQLHCCGRDEEFCCRFCKQPLPHWKQALTPSSVPPDASGVAPLMSIQFHGQTYWLQVHMGEGGVDQFKADVKRLLDLNSDEEFDITFECQVPGEGGKLELHGLQSFDAAVYCASVSAAERMAGTSADPLPPVDTSTECGEAQPNSTTSSSSSPAIGSRNDAETGRPQLQPAGWACTGGAEFPRGPRSSRHSDHGERRRSSGGSSSSSSGGSSSSSGMILQRSGSYASSYGTAVDDAWQSGWENVITRPSANSQADATADGGLGVVGALERGAQGVWAVASRAWSWTTRRVSGQ